MATTPYSMIVVCDTVTQWQKAREWAGASWHKFPGMIRAVARQHIPDNIFDGRLRAAFERHDTELSTTSSAAPSPGLSFRMPPGLPSPRIDPATFDLDARIRKWQVPFDLDDESSDLFDSFDVGPMSSANTSAEFAAPRQHGLNNEKGDTFVERARRAHSYDLASQRFVVLHL